MPTPLINLQEVATPGGTPSAGYGYIWVDSSDSRPYFKSDGGTTVPMFVSWSSIAASPTPSADNTYDLGSTGTRWRAGFFKSGIQVQGTSAFQVLTTEGNCTFGDSSGDSHLANGSLSVTGEFSSGGTSTLAGLGVTGATTLSSTLGVTGATTLSSTLGVTGATTLSGGLNVTGDTTVTGTVQANAFVGSGGAGATGSVSFNKAIHSTINLQIADGLITSMSVS